MTTTARIPAPPDEGIAIALDGGPMTGQWFSPEDWAAYREAARRRVTQGPAALAGTGLRGHQADHPQPVPAATWPIGRRVDLPQGWCAMSAVPEVRDGVQLDLFGEVEQALAVAEQQQDATATLRGQWEALVRYWPDGTPVTWTAPWDCADGTPEGSVVPAYRCPLCGQVAGSEFLLGNDHGMGLDDWSRRASDASGCWEPRTHCTRLSLLDSQQSSLWSRTVCRGMRCSTCGRRNADPERRWHRLAGDADGEHCDCPCHDHTACQTADRCIPMIEAAGARYLAHAQAHEIPRGRWQCGSEVLIDGTRVRVVGISYPASVEHTVHYTARPIGRTDEITHWLETWQARKWVPNVAVQPAPKAPKSTRKPRQVVEA